VSRHHIQPPVVYTPPPQPKKIEKRATRRIGKADSSGVAGTDEAESGEAAATFDSPIRNTTQQKSDPFAPVEGAEGRTQRSAGKLSENTLKTMLQAQEQTGAPASPTFTAVPRR
jgi:hypothetical protein